MKHQRLIMTASNLEPKEPEMITEETPWGPMQRPMSPRERFLSRADKGLTPGRKALLNKGQRKDPWVEKERKMAANKRKMFGQP